MQYQLLKSVSLLWKRSEQYLIKSDSGNKNLKVNHRLIPRLRYILQTISTKMDLNSSVVPPVEVKGMTVLNKEAFTTLVKIPGVKVPKQDIGKSQKIWKSLLFKVRGLKPVCELGDNDPERKTHSLILLDPDKTKLDALSPEQLETLKQFGLDVNNPVLYEVKLKYENWSTADIMRAVLPSDFDNVTSFTQIGHIAHLNLKPESLPYKHLIGEVLLDKAPSVKTVVNKMGTIDNTYRNFQMELLAGPENYVTQTKEHNCTFELDFSKVYWNSRLATEHQRLVEIIPKKSIVYDVFAGIGPFSVPLGKRKKCKVFANDLNPHSFEYLKRNIHLNKIDTDCVEAFNLDGRDFIRTIVKQDVLDRVKKMHEKLGGKNTAITDSGEKVQEDIREGHNSSFVIMNLPAIAIEFLSEFNRILEDLPQHLRRTEILEAVLPVVYCYAFSPKTDFETELKSRAELSLGHSLPKDYSIRIVRNVAPNKEMVCLSFKLWSDLVLGLSANESGENVKRNSSATDLELGTEQKSKKMKLIAE
ncbi:unnamed protein product [Lymnaea stagnalis]|uniref:tRNA (guanine(37)-N1)-methyltransferase n=1 Tax=Lymnaea stagnalis TaxID=6523 RepID=A0AAV2IBR2_LYMST